MEKKLTPAQIVILAAGAVAFIASFLPWLDFDFGNTSSTVSAWGSGAFPTYTWVGIIGLVMALAVGLPAFTNVNLPQAVMGFTWVQLHLILGFIATLIAISFLIVDKGSYDIGIGGWLGILAGVALLVGAVMLQREPTTTAAGGDIV